VEWVGDGVVWVGGLRGVGEAKVGQDWMSVGVGGGTQLGDRFVSFVCVYALC
jgi:hypothetical protein